MLVIGIAGGTGSGKTTVVNQIINELANEDVTVISQDSYYHETDNLSITERAKINFDHPRAIDFDLLVKHIAQLKKGKTILQPVYSFAMHNRTKDTVKTHASKVLIVEGILIFSHKDLRDMMDIKVFVHADTDERLIRRLKRDVNERGWDLDETIEKYQAVIKPMHEQFIEPTKEYADIIIPNNKYNTVAIAIVRTIINERLQ